MAIAVGLPPQPCAAQRRMLPPPLRSSVDPITEPPAAYVGVVPALKHSGKRQPMRAGITNIGHARLRAKLWMPTLTAVRKNPWLRAFYERLRAAGKLPKVALVAAMRKLLSAILSVAKNGRPFVPQLTANTGASP